MEIIPEIEFTSDGSQTLRHPITGDTYHSVNGAVSESMHVFIRHGFGNFAGRDVKILEVGFGSGLNAFLTLSEAEKSDNSVFYSAVELYPVAMDVVSSMAMAADPRFVKLHEAAWDCVERITDRFELHKMVADLTVMEFDTIFDLVYFDAFAPDSQPELWSAGIFRKLYGHMSDGGILVTYSAKGDVKRALRAAGFAVERLEGAPGKRHMLRAVKRKI